MTIPSLDPRYRLIQPIGKGGMGAVYAVTDRLTNKQVALKAVSAEAGDLVFTSRVSSQADPRAALATEFEALASLRHPNIISVIDYGFNAEHQPYFTMDWLQNAQTIVEASQAQPLPVQLGLLAQMLQALAYLHRREVIHRDLKPSNVLVVEGAVRVLDFGLSVAANQASIGITGTMAYISPEVLLGQSAQIQSDLYAVGVIAYEMLANCHPFALDSSSKGMVNAVLNAQPDLSLLKVSPDIVAVVAQLLAKNPRDRFADANAVLAALSRAGSTDFAIDDQPTRESYLQAASFVGREAETKQLMLAVAALTGKDDQPGKGEFYLVGGESGVGKSRLTSEVATQALVKGVRVLRGQAISEGGAAFQVWRDILRSLSLYSSPTDFEASVLRSVISDIEQLTERPANSLPALPELAPAAATMRLAATVEAIIVRVNQPLLFVLEDLQWASSENLALLERLAMLCGKFPLLIVATYRNDERPDLPQSFPTATNIRLARLAGPAIEALSAAMLGEIGAQQPVLALIKRESEGNAFFIIEVVRALAESAQGLANIGKNDLPLHVFAGGMKQMVARRLSQVAASDRPLLEVAAALGRALDLAALQAANLLPAADLEPWLGRCMTNAILAAADGGAWRFAHDKIREGLLDTLPPATRQNRHHQAALCLEAAGKTNDVAALAYHWRQAAEPDRELPYLIRCVEESYSNSAYAETTAFSKRALQLLKAKNMSEGYLSGHILRIMAESQYGIGELHDSLALFQQSLQVMGYPVDRDEKKAGPNLLGELFTHFRPRLRAKIRAEIDVPTALESVRAYERIGGIYYVTNKAIPGVYSTVRGMNIAEQLPASAELARIYANMCLAMSIIGVDALANRFKRQALATINAIDDMAGLAYVLQPISAHDISRGNWADATAFVERARSIGKEIADEGRYLECTGLAAILWRLRGDLPRALSYCQNLHLHVHSSKHILAWSWGAVGQAEAMVLTQRDQEAADLIDLTMSDSKRVEMIRSNASAIHRLYAVRALADLNLGFAETALAYCQEGVACIGQSRPTTVFTAFGYFNIAEVLLRLSQNKEGYSTSLNEQAKKLLPAALSGCKAATKSFPVLRPIWQLYMGWAAQLGGNEAKAQQLWQAGLALSEKTGLPYDAERLRKKLAQPASS
jgi:eukaryotic-like serine/threonine-protein kinase